MVFNIIFRSMSLCKLSDARSTFNRTTTIVVFTKGQYMPPDLLNPAIAMKLKHSNTYTSKPTNILGYLEEKLSGAKLVEYTALTRSATYLAITAHLLPPRYAASEDDAIQNPRVIVINAKLPQFAHRLIPTLVMTGYQVAAICTLDREVESINALVEKTLKAQETIFPKFLAGSVFTTYLVVKEEKGDKGDKGDNVEKKKKGQKKSKGKGHALLAPSEKLAEREVTYSYISLVMLMLHRIRLLAMLL
jgi:hypothetical protein